MIKLTIKLSTRNPQTKRLKEVEIDCVMPGLSLEAMFRLWSAEHAINQYTSIRMHMAANELPDDVTVTERLEKDGEK